MYFMVRVIVDGNTAFESKHYVREGAARKCFLAKQLWYGSAGCPSRPKQTGIATLHHNSDENDEKMVFDTIERLTWNTTLQTWR